MPGLSAGTASPQASEIRLARQVAPLSDASDVTSVLSVPPFQYQQLKKPGIHTVLNSYEVFGGPRTFTVA
jgi:hypothetical protein